MYKALNFLKNLYEALKVNGFWTVFTSLFPAVYNTVKTIEEQFPNLPGEEKRKKALDMLTPVFKNIGKNLLNIALEMAVQFLKAKMSVKV